MLGGGVARGREFFASCEKRRRLGGEQRSQVTVPLPDFVSCRQIFPGFEEEFGNVASGKTNCEN